MRGAAFETLVFGSALLLSASAFAQGSEPPTAGYPATEPPPPMDSPPPVATQPAYTPPPPTSQPPPAEYTPPPDERRDPRPPSRVSDVEEPLPPPPPEAEHHGFKMPPWSVRIDPFTWVLEGKLGVELEVGLLKWLSVEVVPVFVSSTKPPTFSSFAARDSDVAQHSNGLGPLSGASIGAGFWLQGKVLHGYVIRAILTDYGYTYTSDTDQFTHTDRWFMGMFGAHNTFGPFTIAGGIGLGVELNRAEYCGRGPSGCNDLLIRLNDGSRGSVAPSFYPVVLAGRLSFGVTFD